MENSAVKARLTNWDLLRSLAMLFVVIVHSTGDVGTIMGYDPGSAIVAFSIICDPVFFALSGYFALRPLRTSLKDYYLNKLITIVLPLVFYSILLYIFNMLYYSLGEMSIGGYFQYFSQLISTGWWFVPTLIPCLIAAPFVYRGFEALTDKWLVTLGGIFAALCAAGIVLMFLNWTFAAAGIETLALFFDTLYKLVPPSILSASLQYFQFFILGGAFHRLSALMSRKTGNILIAIGMVCWALDIAWEVIGIPKANLNYFWVFTTFAILIVFSRLTVKGKTATHAITWVAKRSYSIYLLQFSTITLLFDMVYAQAVFGSVDQLIAPLRLAVWAATTLASYLMALLVASVLDPLALNRLQGVLKRKLLKPRE